MVGALSIDEIYIIKIFKKYLREKLFLQKLATNKELQEKTFSYSQKDYDLKDLIQYQDYLQIVETILALLPKKEYTCLVKEFLTANIKNWWKKHYSWNQYKLIKKEAIAQFLYLFLI